MNATQRFHPAPAVPRLPPASGDQSGRQWTATGGSANLTPGEAGGCLIVALALVAIVVVLLTPILWITLGLGIIALLVWGLLRFFRLFRGDRFWQWGSISVFSALIAGVGSLMLWWGGRTLSAHPPKPQPTAKAAEAFKGKAPRKGTQGKRHRQPTQGPG